MQARKISDGLRTGSASRAERAASAYVGMMLRRVSAALLFSAAVACSLGFLTAYLMGLGYHYEFEREYALNGQPFPSGKSYWWLTVSEMIRNDDLPTGQVFRAFATIFTMCYFSSGYPWLMRNVYLRDRECGGRGSMMNFMRHIFPPVGCILLVEIPTSPSAASNSMDFFSMQLHSLGAFLMFVSYIVIEGYTVFGRKVPMSSQERFLRRVFVILMCFLALIFISVNASFDSLESLGVCCVDKYRAPTQEDIDSAKNTRDATTLSNAMRWKRAFLVDTASETVRWLKKLCYFSESLLGIVFALSHLIIWYYSNERKIHLTDTIDGVQLSDIESYGSSEDE